MRRNEARAGRMRSRSVALVLGLVGVAGLSIASAAQLDLNGGTLGAGTAVVASCQPANQPLSVTFATTYSSTAPAGYRATAVNVTNVRGCANRQYSIQLTGAGGIPLGSAVTGTVGAGAGPTTIGGLVNSVPVTQITGVSVVIHS